MKKIVPFIFPLVAFLIVLFLLYRWYTIQVVRRGQINLNGSQTQVEELSTFPTPVVSPTARIGADSVRGAADLKTIPLSPVASGSAELPLTPGSIRYQVVDQAMELTVFADLPNLTAGQYQVWVQQGSSLTKAFTLVAEKGGYTGSMTLPLSRLPVEMTVSWEQFNDNKLEQSLLKASITQP